MSHRYELELGGRPLIIETGTLAQQAGGAVTVRYGDTMMLGTVTAGKPRPGIDFFPLTIEFEERLYAAGRIPGSFFRREGRPTTSAVLSARLTDRPLRPLFPAGYGDDTQIVITILSVDMENPPDTLGTIAASAALTISDVPFGGPVGSVRVGHVDGALVLQPTFEQLAESDLNLVVAGTADGIMMVEAEAGEVPEQLLVEAMALGQEAIGEIVALQQRMQTELGREKRSFTPKVIDEGALTAVRAAASAELEAVLAPDSGLSKAERDRKRNELRAGLLEGQEGEAAEARADAFGQLEREVVRRNILEQGGRADGRSTTDLRPLRAEVATIPRTHGSGLFERGETQVLSLTTLAGTGMAQRLDDLTPESTKRFMHHYNFPPFSVGETGRIGSPGRREVGHGMLGERAMTAVLPDYEDFPYTIRIVSEVLSSNGSTSMASVCAAILSLMDAGVPIKSSIAGVAMGLIKGEDGFAVLTDITGMEDHLGDMDFKVAGSREGVTALQMDIKVTGITLDIMSQALEQAREARLQVLEVMLETIAEPRAELSRHAPRMTRVEVPTEKIGVIIGPGGRTIRQLEEESGASIDIQDDGSVYVTAVDAASAEKAIDQIKALTKEVEPGEVYTGKVTRTLPFGAFVEILPGKDALVHISELADYRVPTVEDVARVGDELTVIITEIDNMGRINASRRALLGREGGGDQAEGGEQGRSEDRGDRGDREDREDRGDRGGRGGRLPPEERPQLGPRKDRPQLGPRRDRPQLAPVGEPAAVAATSESPSDSGPGEGVAGRRRRRRRRKKGSGGDGGGEDEPAERQPESNDSGRSRIRAVFARGSSRRRSGPSDEPPAPPPPPRPDFGAPAH